MPPKRPPTLVIVPESKAVSITDTMTLVVKGEGGEVRVKENGIAQVSQSTPQIEQTTPDEESGKLKFEDLTLGRELGMGSQGKVRIVQHKETGEKFALKYIGFDADSEDMRQGLESELRQVVAVKDKNVVSSYEAFFRNGRLYIVLEYMNAGTMKDVMMRHKKISEEMLAYIARELFKGLKFLHSLNIIHRDIKPANVLANTKGEVKISDFGVAKVLSSGNLQTLSSQGSVPYMSPERINSRPYTLNSDVWSAGLVIAECALGRYPFASVKSNMYEICQIITSENVKVDWEKCDNTFSQELRDFVDWCLNPAEKRPGAEELLQHPFIRKADSVQPSEAGKWFGCKSS